MKELKSNLQNKPATAHWSGQGVGVGQDAELSLWAELSPFPSWHRKYAIETISDVVKETWAKTVKEITSNLQKKHAAAAYW